MLVDVSKQLIPDTPARRRKGKDKPVIRKALVDLDGPVFGALAANRAAWAIKDAYRCTAALTAYKSKTNHT